LKRFPLFKTADLLNKVEGLVQKLPRQEGK
jgi:hypothetical protein